MGSKIQKTLFCSDNNLTTSFSVIIKEKLSTYIKLKLNKTEKEKTTTYTGNSLEDKIMSSSSVISNTVKTIFLWDEGGNTVYITGSFCGWKEFFLMTKSNNDTFTYSIELPRGFHQYKFKVDGQWKYSIKFPIYNDHGHINNYIDTTYYDNRKNCVPEINFSGKEEAKYRKEKAHQYKKRNENNNIKKTNESKNYNINYPQRCSLNINPPKIICYLKELNNFNMYQRFKRNRQYLEENKKDQLNDNFSYQKIREVPHIILNHLINQRNNLKSYLICTTTTRYKHKNICFAYYKPNYSKEN